MNKVNKFKIMKPVVFEEKKKNNNKPLTAEEEKPTKKVTPSPRIAKYVGIAKTKKATKKVTKNEHD